MPDGAVTYDFLRSRPESHRSSASGRAYATLRESIISLDFKPGEMLDKPVIAARLGVSRFPVAEAMSRLAAEGLVDIVPQSGTRVALIRIADARENMFLRRALETETVRHIALAPSPALIDGLRQNLRYQRTAIDADDPQGFHGFDLSFHAMLQEQLGFTRVRNATETARLSLERVRRLLNTRRRLDITLAEHKAVVDALSQRNPDAAASAMRMHLDAVLAELERFAEERPQLFADLDHRGDTAA